MDTKAFAGDVRIKSVAERKVSAHFAQLSVIDLDGDVTQPGDIAPGQRPICSDFGHSAMKDRPPVGHGVVWGNSQFAGVDVQYSDNAAGHDAFTMIRELHEAGSPVGWSYGFEAKRERVTFEGKTVNRLRDVRVIEVSPVAVPAGIGTGTLSAKGGHACSCGHNGNAGPVAVNDDTLRDLGREGVAELKQIHGGMLFDMWKEREAERDRFERMNYPMLADEIDASQKQELRELLNDVAWTHRLGRYSR